MNSATVRRVFVTYAVAVCQACGERYRLTGPVLLPDPVPGVTDVTTSVTYPLECCPVCIHPDPDDGDGLPLPEAA